MSATSQVRSRATGPYRRGAAIALALGLVVLIAGVASAHDTWLIAANGVAKVGTPISLRLTSGELFPNDDFAIDPARVRRAVVRIGSATTPLAKPRSGALALQYQWTPTTPGIATFGVEFAPNVLTLEPDKIEEYLTEIDATKDIRVAWSALGGKRKWVESYSKHATSYVRVGESRDSSWRQPLGFGLEIVPEHDPTQLHARDTLPVRVLMNGKPQSGFAVGAIREGQTAARFAHTDATGRARVVIDAPGRWLLNGTDLRRTTKPGLVWESDFVTMTLFVR